MEAPDAFGLVDQEPGGPQVVAQVVPAGLELGGQTAVENRQALARQQPGQRVAQDSSGPTMIISPRLVGEWSKLMNSARRMSSVCPQPRRI